MRGKILLSIVLLFVNISLSAQFANIVVEDTISQKNDIVDFAVDAQKNLWVATSAGVFRYEGEKWTAPVDIDFFAHALHITASNQIWVAPWGGGIFKVDGAKKELEQVKEASANSIGVYTIQEDKKGNLWIGTWDKGLVQGTGNRWTNYTISNSGLSDNSVLSVAFDGDITWLGTYRGLSSFDGKKWTTYNKQNSQLPDHCIYSLTVDFQHNLWIGTSSGLAKMDQRGQITVYNTENSALPSNMILAIRQDSLHNLWIGTNKGLVRLKENNWSVYTVTNSNLIEDRVQAIEELHDRLYIGTSMGISTFELK